MIYEVQASGLGPQTWAEKSLVVEGKEKNASYNTAAERAVISGRPQKGTFVTVEAESNAEAIKAVRAVYGQGNVNGKFYASKTGEELAPQP